jgi:hypothetical protein
MVNKHQYLKISAVALALGGLFTAPAVSKAGTAVSDGKASKAMVEEVTKSCITGDLGVNVVSKYFSRGINNGDQGVIVQPYADLYFKLYDGNGFINTITLNLGIWSSLHSSHVGVPNNTVSAWQEFDYTPGLAVTFAKNFTLTTSYFEFDYPSGLSDPQRSINVNLAYNDADLLGAFALHPHVTVLFELPGAPAGLREDGVYFEVGIAPSIPLVKEGTFPVTLTLPMTAGLGDEDFYANSNYGYFSAGANIAVGLGFMPKCLGTWTVTGGATYYNLGDTTAALNRNNEHNDWVFSGGMAVAF